VDNIYVSCIMPTKNRRRFVERALKMFIEQNFNVKHTWLCRHHLELIVIEDGDEDCSDLCLGSEYVCGPRGERIEVTTFGRRAEYASSVRYVRFEGSLGAKLNEGARLARGHYLINWDDDDFHHPNRVTNIVNHFDLTDASMVGMSSMPYWREGDEDVWIYNAGDARYCTGSGQAFLRDWVLANPHPDQTVGEDEVITRMAAEQGVLSTISGTDWVVACTHDSHCTERSHPGAGEWEKFFGRPADNWQRSHINKFRWITDWALPKSSTMG